MVFSLCLGLLVLVAGCEKDPTMIEVSGQDEPDAAEEEVGSDTDNLADAKEDNSSTRFTPPESQAIDTGTVLLDTQYPTVVGDLGFSRSGSVAYDAVNKVPPHWRITAVDGYIAFMFRRPLNFNFHALGSTVSGISYCYIDVYVNDEIYWYNKFIHAGWADYTIPASAFRAGAGNYVKIVLRGKTHLWVDQVYTE